MGKVGLALAAFVGACAVVWTLTLTLARPSCPRRLSDEARSVVLHALRSAEWPTPSPAVATELEAPAPWPVIVTVVNRGNVLARVVGQGATIREATLAAARALPNDARRTGRMTVDRVGHLSALPPLPDALLALAVAPGQDGLRVTTADRDEWLTPSDIVQGGFVMPGPAFLAELALGVDVVRVRARAPHARLARVRTEAFAEPATRSDPPLGIERGVITRTTFPSESRDALEAFADRAGDYLLRHIDERGKFDYEYDPRTDRRSDGYSIGRHAGAIYFLAQMQAAKPSAARADAVRRAALHLLTHTPADCPLGTLCIASDDEDMILLGTTALALIALAEMEAATGDRSFHERALALGAFVLRMQQPNGSFVHRYNPRRRAPDDSRHLMFADGQAALALARLHTIDSRAVDPLAIERAVASLAAVNDHFAGQFYIGEETWTCLAGDSAWHVLTAATRERVANLCSALAAFQARFQLPDGGYGLGPLFVTPTAVACARSEALVSTIAMNERLGRDTRAQRDQLRSAARYILSRQLTDDSALFARVPEASVGGVPLSELRPEIVRIDFVQHCGSAMLRAAARE